MDAVTAEVALGSLFDDSIPKFIITPDGDDRVIVDYAQYEQDDTPLDAGPFKGMKVCIPVPDGRDDPSSV